MGTTSTQEKVLSLIRQEELVELATTLGSIPSPTGEEKAVGDFLHQWLKGEGFQPFKQQAAEGRENVVARLPGKGGGKSLIFNSHMDTAFWSPQSYWVVEKEERHYNHAWVEDGKIHGQGVVNDKGPMAAFLIAAKALRDSGAPLRGDVILTMVVGEIGGAPIDEFQGPAYLGKGFGARHLVDHGVVADCALVAESTGFGLTWAQCGALYIKVTTRGRGVYTPYIQRPHPVEESPNALIQMAKLVLAIEEWAFEYEQKQALPLEFGEIRPKVSVGAIRSGLPFRPSTTPAICSSYLDVRLVPDADPDPIVEEIQSIARKVGVGAEVQVYLYRPGYIAKDIGHLKGAIEAAHHAVLGGKPGGVTPPVTSLWRDVNIFNAAGIPSMSYGPGTGAGGGTTYVTIEGLLKASQVYALTALHACT